MELPKLPIQCRYCSSLAEKGDKECKSYHGEQERTSCSTYGCDNPTHKQNPFWCVDHRFDRSREGIDFKIEQLNSLLGQKNHSLDQLSERDKYALYKELKRQVVTALEDRAREDFDRSIRELARLQLYVFLDDELDSTIYEPDES